MICDDPVHGCAIILGDALQLRISNYVVACEATLVTESGGFDGPAQGSTVWLAICTL